MLEGSKASHKLIEIFCVINMSLMIVWATMLFFELATDQDSKLFINLMIVAGCALIVGAALLAITVLAREHIDDIANSIMTKEVVRRRLKGTVLCRAIVQEIETSLGFGRPLTVFGVAIKIDDDWIYILDDINVYRDFMQAGEEVIVVIDEHHNKQDQPFLHKLVTIEYLDSKGGEKLW